MKINKSMRQPPTDRETKHPTDPQSHAVSAPLDQSLWKFSSWQMMHRGIQFPKGLSWFWILVNENNNAVRQPRALGCTGNRVQMGLDEVARRSLAMPWLPPSSAWPFAIPQKADRVARGCCLAVGRALSQGFIYFHLQRLRMSSNPSGTLSACLWPVTT